MTPTVHQLTGQRLSRTIHSSTICEPLAASTSSVMFCSLSAIRVNAPYTHMHEYTYVHVHVYMENVNVHVRINTVCYYTYNGIHTVYMYMYMYMHNNYHCITIIHVQLTL